jgi:hypothetical protein
MKQFDLFMKWSNHRWLDDYIWIRRVRRVRGRHIRVYVHQTDDFVFENRYSYDVLKEKLVNRAMQYFGVDLNEWQVKIIIDLATRKC